MTLDKLKNLFATRKLKVLNTEIVYTFKDNTMLKNGKYLTNFELYEEEGKFYLNTKPYIYDSEDLAIEFKNEKPIFINLSTRIGLKYFVTLVEI